MKRLIAILLSVAMAAPQFASARATTSTPEKAMKAFETYLRLQSSTKLLEEVIASKDIAALKKKAKAEDLELWKEISQAYSLAFSQDRLDTVALTQLIKIARSEMMTQALAADVLSLEANDHNVFLLAMMERFVVVPHDRQAIFDFLTLVRQSLEPELQHNETLKQGLSANILDSSALYVGLILISSLVLRRFIAKPLNRTQLMTSMRERAVAIGNKSKVLKYGGRAFGNSFTLSLVGGSAAGTLDYMLEASRAQKLDPALIMIVVQTQLACKLSYDALELHQRIDGLFAMEDETEKEKAFSSQAPALHRLVADHTVQTTTLAQQFQWLASLRIDDPIFQTYLDHVPKAKNWQELRSRLNSEKVEMNGTCHQVSLAYVLQELEILKNSLPELPAPEVAAPVVTTPEVVTP